MPFPWRGACANEKRLSRKDQAFSCNGGEREAYSCVLGKSAGEPHAHCDKRAISSSSLQFPIHILSKSGPMQTELKMEDFAVPAGYRSQVLKSTEKATWLPLVNKLLLHSDDSSDDEADESESPFVALFNRAFVWMYFFFWGGIFWFWIGFLFLLLLHHLQFSFKCSCLDSTLNQVESFTSTFSPDLQCFRSITPCSTVHLVRNRKR